MSLLMGRHSTSQIVCRADVDVAIAQFEEVDVPHVVAVSLRSYGASGDTPFALPAFGWPATRSPSGRRVAEPEGFFSMSITVY